MFTPEESGKANFQMVGRTPQANTQMVERRKSQRLARAGSNGLKVEESSVKCFPLFEEPTSTRNLMLSPNKTERKNFQMVARPWQGHTQLVGTRKSLRLANAGYNALNIEDKNSVNCFPLCEEPASIRNQMLSPNKSDRENFQMVARNLQGNTQMVGRRKSLRLANASLKIEDNCLNCLPLCEMPTSIGNQMPSPKRNERENFQMVARTLQGHTQIVRSRKSRRLANLGSNGLKIEANKVDCFPMCELPTSIRNQMLSPKQNEKANFQMVARTRQGNTQMVGRRKSQRLASAGSNGLMIEENNVNCFPLCKEPTSMRNQILSPKKTKKADFQMAVRRNSDENQKENSEILSRTEFLRLDNVGSDNIGENSILPLRKSTRLVRGSKRKLNEDSSCVVPDSSERDKGDLDKREKMETASVGPKQVSRMGGKKEMKTVKKDEKQSKAERNTFEEFGDEEEIWNSKNSEGSFECFASEGWSEDQEAALQKAYLTVKPVPKFWKEVSKLVPGKSAQECFDRIHSVLPTPSLSRPRSTISGKSVTKMGSLTPYKDKVLLPAGHKPNRTSSGKRSLLARKTVRHLLRKHSRVEQGHEVDLFALIEGSDSPLCSLPPTPDCLYKPSTFLQSNQKVHPVLHSKPLSEIKNIQVQQGLMSPEVLKQVKNLALHEKYIDQLHSREMKRNMGSRNSSIGNNVGGDLQDRGVFKVARTALVTETMDVLKKLESNETSPTINDEEFEDDLDNENDANYCFRHNYNTSKQSYGDLQ
ncbi:hypothetical protein AMTRI_Chr09g14080 [Amborella trichopoda]